MDSSKFFNAEADNNWMREVMGDPVRNNDAKCQQFVLAQVEMSLSKYKEAYEHFLYAYRSGYYPKGKHGYYDVLKVYLELKALDQPDEDIKQLLTRYFSEDVANGVLDDIKSGKIYREAEILLHIDSQELNLITSIYNKLILLVQASRIDMSDLIQ